MPVPRGLDDRVQIRVARLPTEHLLEPCRRRRRVAADRRGGAAPSFTAIVLPVTCSAAVDHFADAVAPAGAEIEAQSLARFDSSRAPADGRRPGHRRECNRGRRCRRASDNRCRRPRCAAAGRARLAARAGSGAFRDCGPRRSSRRGGAGGIEVAQGRVAEPVGGGDSRPSARSTASLVCP